MMKQRTILSSTYYFFTCKLSVLRKSESQKISTANSATNAIHNALPNKHYMQRDLLQMVQRLAKVNRFKFTKLTRYTPTSISMEWDDKKIGVVTN